MSKRILSVFLLILTFASFAFFSASCSRDTHTADEIATKILSAYDSIPPCSQYIKDAKEFTKGYISESNFNNLYTGITAELAEWDCIAEFRLVLSDSPNVFEIHVMKADNISDTGLIEKLLIKRADLIENFRKTASKYFTANEAVVYLKGKYVFLLVTPDNEKAIRIIDSML